VRGGLLLRCATQVSEEYVADVRDGGIRITGGSGGVYGGESRRDEWMSDDKVASVQ
jgi:hypothetical protein